MRIALAALVATAALAGPVAPAHATQYDFQGGCEFTASQQEATGDERTGEVDVVLYAASVVETPTRQVHVPEPTVAVTDVWCELFVNRESRGRVLTAPDGTGATAAVAPLTYHASFLDVVEVCTHATVGGTPLFRCPTPTYWPPEVWPPEVQYLFDVLHDVILQTDPVLCDALRALAALNDVAPGVLYVHPDTGDIDLLGGLFWDCPPYEET